MQEKYDVKVTRYALAQMQDIRSYIVDELCNPQAAKRLLLNMKKSINSLSEMPSRHPVVEEYNGEEIIRRIVVQNFLVYYWIDETNQCVYVTAVIYARRNQLVQLEKMDLK